MQEFVLYILVLSYHDRTQLIIIPEVYTYFSFKNNRQMFENEIGNTNPGLPTLPLSAFAAKWSKFKTRPSDARLVEIVGNERCIVRRSVVQLAGVIKPIHGLIIEFVFVRIRRDTINSRRFVELTSTVHGFVGLNSLVFLSPSLLSLDYSSDDRALVAYKKSWEANEFLHGS